MLLLKSVDYGRMAEILVQRAGSPDEFTRLTAITWVSGYAMFQLMRHVLLAVLSLKEIIAFFLL